MAISRDITRRAIVGALTAAASATSLPVAAAQRRKDAEWLQLTAQAAAFHPDGAEVVAKARAAGLDIDRWAGMGKAGRGYERGRFMLQFEDEYARPACWVDLDGVHLVAA